MAVSAHEVNYTPSKWSKRFDDVQILAHFMKFSTEVTENARKTTKCQLDVQYGTTERSKYDIYGTNLSKDAPIFIFIHGGYWQECSKDIAAFCVPALVANGTKVVVIGYDLCAKVRLGVIVTQIKTAIEHILKSALNSGTRSVWIAGHSAGAHLAASLLHDNSWLERITKQGYSRLLKGIVLIGGIYKLEPLVATSFNEALNLTKEEIDRYSFSLIDTKRIQSIQGLKVIVAVGECDSPVFIDESREYAQKLITMVDNVQYILIRENVDHFDIVERLVDKTFILTKLILQNILAP